MRRHLKTIVASLAVVGLMAYLFTGPSEEERILATLESARALWEVGEEKLHPIEAAQQAKELISHFTESVQFEIQLDKVDHLRIVGREELRKHVLAAKTHLHTLEIQVSDPEVKVGDGVATAEITASALGTFPGEKGQFLEMHRLQLSFREVGSDWQIAKVSHIKNLRD